MKKVILSVVIIAGVLLATNIQDVQAIQGQPAVTSIMDQDEFVDVQLSDLSEAVQAVVNAFTEEYEISALKYNAEKQLTKVKLTNKNDQSSKTVYLDAEGKEVEAPAEDNAPEQTEQTEQETPMS